MSLLILSCLESFCCFRRMETPHKDNDCEKQLMATLEMEEFHKRNLKSEFAAWRRKIKPLFEVLGMKPDNSLGVVGKLIVASEEELEKAGEQFNNGLISGCQVRCSVV